MEICYSRCIEKRENKEKSKNSEINIENNVQYGENYEGYKYNVFLQKGDIKRRFKEDATICNNEWSKYIKDKKINEEKEDVLYNANEITEKELTILIEKGKHNYETVIYTKDYYINHLYVDHKEKLLYCYLE